MGECHCIEKNAKENAFDFERERTEHLHLQILERKRIVSFYKIDLN